VLLGAFGLLLLMMLECWQLLFPAFEAQLVAH